MEDENIGEVQMASIEQSPATEFSFSGNRILSGVINSGLWKDKDSSGNSLFSPEERISDVEALRKLTLDEFARREVDYDEEVDLPPVEILTSEVRDQLHLGVKGLIAKSIITEEASQLAAKWTGQEDVQVIDEGTGSAAIVPLDIDDTVFPTPEGNKPYIQITRKSIVNKINHYREKGRKVGLQISENDLQSLALRSIVLHEWSHSLEKAIGIDFYQKLIHSDGYDDEKDGWDALRARRNVVFNNALNTEPVIDRSKKSIEAEAHGERFASGFEFETTLEMLEELGVPSDKAVQFIREILDERTTYLDEFRRIRSSSSFTDDQILSLGNDVDFIARQHNIPINIIKPWVGLGYYAPYSAEQLKHMVGASMVVLGNPNKIQETLQIEQPSTS